jgi:hypothetical protein
MAQIKETIQLPRKLKPAQREVIAEEVIDFIRDRSFAGLDKNNRKFKKYSDKYAERKGVPIDEVDLVLTGELMEKLQVLKITPSEITIGYEKGDSVNAKAEGNITGSYGREPNRKKARDFLGITRKDLMSIVDTYTGENDGE